MIRYLLGLWCLASAFPAFGAFPLTITDDSGMEITLPKPPVRILSLTLLADEVLFDILPPGRFAAVTDLAVNPQVCNTAARAAMVPRRISFSVEGIISLKPDLVILALWSDPGKVRQLRSLGLPVFQMSSPTNPNEIRHAVTRLALLVGEETKGLGLLDQMQATLAEVGARVGARSQTLTVLDYNTWGASSGKGTSWDGMVQAAGLRNAAGALVQDQWGQVPLSREILISLDPDGIFLPGWNYGQGPSGQEFLEQFLRDPGFKNLKARRSSRVMVFPENLKSSVSHYWAQGVRYLAQKAYPELF